MNSFMDFIALDARDRRGVYEESANALQTLPVNVEKDFWVCLVLDALFNRKQSAGAKLLFKGGTSLSKGFSLIKRFSEDIDIVVFREDLGFSGEGDPTNRDIEISNKKRDKLFDKLKEACGTFVHDELAAELAELLGPMNCIVERAREDVDGQTLLVSYRSDFSTNKNDYVKRSVRIECGARSARDPHITIGISPYVATQMNTDWDLAVPNIRTIAPTRTYWEKILILHGVYCGFRDEVRLPTDPQRLSRHYYDVAMIGQTPVAAAAHANDALWADVREHNLVAFRQPWKKFDEAVRGKTRITPQAEVRRELERDYRAMVGMIFGTPPDFDWIVDQLRTIEELINTERTDHP